MQTTSESLARAIADLEASVERAGPILEAEVGTVCQDGDRWRVTAHVMGVESGSGWQPSFPSREDAEAFREAAIEIIDRAS